VCNIPGFLLVVERAGGLSCLQLASGVQCVQLGRAVATTAATEVEEQRSDRCCGICAAQTLQQ